MDKDEHDADPRLVPARAALACKSAPWPLENSHLYRGSTRRRYLRSLCSRWADQWPQLSGLGRAMPGPDIARRRHRRARQSRQSQGAGGARSHTQCQRRLLFLPPYSPDLNPIEQVFAKLKTLLRKAAARSVEETWRGIGNVLNAFTPQECKNYVRNSGYASA